MGNRYGKTRHPSHKIVVLKDKKWLRKSSAVFSLMAPPENEEFNADSIDSTMNSSSTIVPTQKGIIKKSKTILRQRLAIQLLFAAFLVMTMLFVWQLATNLSSKKGPKSEKEALNSDGLLELESRQCPYVPSQHLLPLFLPSQVTKRLQHTDFVFNTLEDLQSLEGLTANIVYRDKVVWKRNYGTRDSKASRQLPPDENTVFRVASVSKIITVLFVLNLLQSGSVNSLDDPLDKYEPRFQVINQYNSEKITLRHVLSHTSGLPREVPCGSGWSRSNKYLCAVNTTYVLRQLERTHLKAPPGLEPNYSNLGYALLARILAQRFAGGDYEAWVTKNVLQPLHMINSGFSLDRMPGNRAISYSPDGAVNSNVDWGWAAPAFQLYSSTADLSKLMMLLFQPSHFSVIKPEHLQQLLTPNYVYPDGQTMFGLGWEMKLTGSYLMVSKAGIVPGFSAGFVLFPQLKLGATVLMSGRDVAPAAAELLLKPLTQRFASYMIQQLKIQVPVNTVQYIGSYKLTSKWIHDVRFNITLEENVLQLHQDPGFPAVSYLNYLNPNILELIYKPGYPCSVYGMGQNHERLEFDPPLASAGQSPGFKFGPFVFVRSSKDSKFSSIVNNMKMSLSRLI